MTSLAGVSMDIPLNAGFNPVRFPALNNETCLNLFEFEGAMIPTPGFTNILENIGNVNENARGIFYSDILNQCVVVIGSALYAITLTSFRKLGHLKTSEGKVYFAENGLTTLPAGADPGAQIAISDNDNIYVYTLDNNLSIALDDQSSPIAFVPGTLAYQNGYFFVNDLNSNRIYASQINNALVFPVLNFDLAAARTRSCVAFKNLLYVFAKDTTNLFYSSPTLPTFPYAPDVSRAWEYGCLSAGSVAVSLGMICWLSNTRYGNPVILFSNGGTPKNISTPGIDALINTFKTPSDSEGFIYEEDGHSFYQLNFNADNKSVLYDFKSQKWTALTDENGLNKSPIRQTAYYEETNTLLAIRNDVGRAVLFGVNIFNYNGKIIPRTIITQNFTQEERPMICQELDLQIEEGVNDVSEADYPDDENLPLKTYFKGSRICLSISKDRGRTFPINRVFDLGQVGFRKDIIRWRKLGYGRWWTFKFDFFSLNRFVIMKATGWFQK